MVTQGQWGQNMKLLCALHVDILGSTEKWSHLFYFIFAGEGGQKNGIHLYILHQASWRPQCVSTAALGVPLSLQGQLCSHEAPAKCKMEKPKGTKFRMSDALGKKNKLLLDSMDSPLPPHAAEVSFCSVWVDFTSGPFPSMGCTNLLVRQTWLLMGAPWWPPLSL